MNSEEAAIQRKLSKEALRQRNKERYQAMKDRPQDFPPEQLRRWHSERELLFGLAIFAKKEETS